MFIGRRVILPTPLSIVPAALSNSMESQLRVSSIVMNILQKTVDVVDAVAGRLD
jgi:hypothetical protein